MKLCPKCQKEFSDDANFCPVCASRLNAAAAPAEADSLAARFDLGAHIGGRRTGPVHRATDKTTGKPAAIKLIDPAVLALPGVAQRIERELKQLERVQSAGVAHVLGSGRRGDDWWVATELLDGAQTLGEAIAARGPIPAEQAAELVELIGEALIEAAQVGVVHRDLAPKNVLFASGAQAQGNDGSVKLINFSLPVPTTEKVPGVPEFVAPEQVDGRAVDQRSNLYSLGALYYFVLTGEPIFSGSAAEVHEQHRSGTIKPASSIVKVPPAVEAVITRALDRSPTKRFLTVRQFVDEVTRVGHGEVIELKQTMAMGRAGAGSNRPRGDLVSTLMGFRGVGGASVVGVATPVVATPVVATPVVASPVVASPVAVTMVSGQADGAKAVAQTMLGTSSGAAAIAPAPRPATQPVVQTTAPAAQPRAASQPVQATIQTMQPMGHAPIAVTQAPVVAAPVVAAPVVAAPVVGKQPLATQGPSGAAAGKKKPDDGASKGKFRETMWFKKGELDAQAAQAAAVEQARTGKVVDSDKADSLPIDERYKDDGSISRSDKEKYSLRTGATQMMAAMPDAKGDGGGKVSEDALIGEMKGGRTWVLVALAAAVVVIAIIVFAIAR